MANYNLVINSKFKPFSYQELLAPVLQATQAHQEIENQYGELAAKANLYADIANEQTSPEAYNMYKKYSDDLNKQADLLSKYGLNNTSKRDMFKIKSRYSSEIAPIATAYEDMKAANLTRSQNPDGIYEISSYNSVDPFLHGKTANNYNISKDALTKKTAAMVEAAFLSELQNPSYNKVMDNQFWEIVQHSGGDYESLKQALAEHPEVANKFTEVKNQVLKDIDYNKYDVIGKQKIQEAINTGLYAGLDKPARTFQANQDHITPLQAHSMAIEDTKLAMEKEEHGAKMKALKPSSSSSSSSSSKGGEDLTDRNKEARTYTLMGSKRNKDAIELMNNSDKGDLTGYTEINYWSLGKKTRDAIKEVYPQEDRATAYSYHVKYNGDRSNYTSIAIVPRSSVKVGNTSIGDNEL